MASRRYRIDFAVILLTGNARRYEIVRPEVDEDQAVAARWFPIRTWFEEDPLRFLPGAIRLRARHFLDSWKLFFTPAADGIVLHAFETVYMYAFLKKALLRSRVVLVNNPDGRITDSLARGQRLTASMWRSAVRHTDLFVPWTEWGARQMRADFPEIDAARIQVLHPGLDLENWPLRPPLDRDRERPFRVLFVGGDLVRKGIDVLLKAFANGLEDCELHVCTVAPWLDNHPDIAAAIAQNPRIVLHLDLAPGSPRLTELFRTCDVFALPTYSDCIPWVALESLATGIPTIMTPVGAIEEAIVDGETGLIVPCGDADALARAIERVRAEPELAERFRVQGRRLVEQKYDVRANTQTLLAEMKRRIDERRCR
jgi:glycosyltransferase involved in cell wall biosynthesis